MLSLLLAFVTASTVPDRIVLTWPGDPSTNAAVTWRTTAQTGYARGQIAVADADPAFAQTATEVVAVTQTLDLMPGWSFYHTVRFEALTPETQYAYRVGDGKTWSEWVHFTTAANRPKPFKFIYFGDAQNDLKSLWSRTIRRAFRDAPYADFILHAGDLCNVPHRDSEWAEWFYAGGWVHASVPVVAVPGNHEYGVFNGEGQRVLSRQWRPQFEFPLNGLAELPETNYYIDFQGLRIVALDSNRDIEVQAVWLDKVLEENPNKWAIVTFHHPVFSTASGRDNKALREAWRPVLERHNVALVLQGHDHSYGRRNEPTGVTAMNEQTGTVYLVSVSGPKMYRVGDEAMATMQKTGERKQLYQIISVDGDRLKYEAFLVTGELYDSFELIKQEDGTNKFVKL